MVLIYFFLKEICIVKSIVVCIYLSKHFNNLFVPITCTYYLKVTYTLIKNKEKKFRRVQDSHFDLTTRIHYVDGTN